MFFFSLHCSTPPIQATKTEGEVGGGLEEASMVLIQKEQRMGKQDSEKFKEKVFCLLLEPGEAWRKESLLKENVT